MHIIPKDSLKVDTLKDLSFRVKKLHLLRFLPVELCILCSDNENNVILNLQQWSVQEVFLIINKTKVYSGKVKHSVNFSTTKLKYSVYYQTGFKSCAI